MSKTIPLLVGCLLALNISLSACSGEGTTKANESSISPETDSPVSNESTSGQTDTTSQSDPQIQTLAAIDAPSVLCVVEYMGNNISFFNADTGESLGKLNVGVNPACLAASSDGASVYVANSGNGQVVRVGLGEEASVQTVRVGTQPMALALDEARGLLYVADYHLNSIRIVDTTLMSLVDTVELEPKGFEYREQAPACCTNPLDGTVLDGRKPVSLSLSPDDSMLYCANIGTYDVSRIDLNERAELDPYDGVIGVRDVVASPDGKTLLVAGVGSELVESNELIVESAEDGSVIARVAVGEDVGGVAWSGADVATVAKGDGLFCVIDPETWKVIWSLPLEPGVADVAFSADGLVAYVGNSTTGTITAIDMASQSVRWSVDGLADPRFLTVVR